MYKVKNLTNESYPIDNGIGGQIKLKPNEEIQLDVKPVFGYNPRHIKIEEIETKDEKTKEVK